MNILTTGLLLFLLWTPRFLTIIFGCFISMFAFDVFEDGKSFLASLPALLIHLIPTFIIAILLVFSWKRPWVGGFGFILLGAGYIWWQGMEYPVIFIPLFAVGVLFMASWILRKKIEVAKVLYQ